MLNVRLLDKEYLMSWGMETEVRLMSQLSRGLW